MNTVKTMKNMLLAGGALLAVSALADVREIKMLPEENWWGIGNNFGRNMPFNARKEFKTDLRLDNYCHQALSLMVSGKGRAVWCPEPVGVAISGGTIRLESDKGEITLVENAGKTLAEAYRYASRTWFPPTGEDPELLYFAAPQYNTWIELTYHQNEKDILDYAQSMLDHGFPPGVFMIDDTWQHGYGTWEFDRRRFSDPKGMVDRLHKMGFKVLLWMCPFVSMDSPEYRRIQFGKNPDDVRGWPTKGGFLASTTKPGWGGIPPAACVEWWNGNSALLDFSHPNAVAWFTEQLDRLRHDYGVDGFKFDGGSVFFYVGSREKPLFAHDPTLSSAAQSALFGQFALKYKGSEYRNVFGFAGKPVIMRLHDKNHNWRDLNRIIPDMLAAGFVGCPFICPDMVGGGEWTAFLPGAPFSQELFVRSAQLQALSPMMQFSASPWRYLDAAHQKIIGDTVALRQKFAPMFVALAKKAAKDGEPMMRNLEYAYPGRGYGEIRDEFLMGEDLLVAPVLEQGAKTRKVVIPPGAWRADDGRTYEGPATVEVETPLARLPHFERLAESGPMVLATEQEQERLVLLSPCAGTNDDSAVRWTWSAKADPGVKPEDVAKFINPSECKLRDGGRTILVTASEGAFADIDVATGRVRAYSVLGDRLVNPHSADRLPDGCYVVASSLGNSLTVVDAKGAELEPAAQRKTKVDLPDAHGVEWDARRNCVWALGARELARYAYDSGRKALTLVKSYPLSKIGFGGGHELVLFPSPQGDRLLLTAHIGGVASFDPDTGEFEVLSRMKYVKSISRFGNYELFVQPAGNRWPDTLTAFSKSDGEKPLTFRLKGAGFYKAKLFSPSAVWRLDRR